MLLVSYKSESHWKYIINFFSLTCISLALRSTFVLVKPPFLVIQVPLVYQEFAISEVTEKQCFPFSSSCTWPLLPYPAFWLEKKIENSPKTLLRLGMCMSMGHETFMEPVFYTISGISEYITENVINEAKSRC